MCVLIHWADVQTDKAIPSLQGRGEVRERTEPASEEEKSGRGQWALSPWRFGCLTSTFFPCFPGNFKGLCKQIDHFPEDADYEADTAEYFLREWMQFFFSLSW